MSKAREIRGVLSLTQSLYRLLVAQAYLLFALPFM